MAGPNYWCPKATRELLCVQQHHAPTQEARDEIGRLISHLDTHRPLGPDGKHGDRHTDTCGCEDKPAPEAASVQGIDLGGPLAPSSYSLTGDGMGWVEWDALGVDPPDLTSEYVGWLLTGKSQQPRITATRTCPRCLWVLVHRVELHGREARLGERVQDALMEAHARVRHPEAVAEQERRDRELAAKGRGE